MIFMRTYDKVLDESKTRTRRPWRNQWRIDYLTLPGELPQIATLRVATVNGYQTVYSVGQLRSVQPGRGKPGERKIRILALNKIEVANAITLEEAREEGYDNPESFRRVWEQMHGPRSLLRPCLEIQFRLEPVEVGDAKP